MPFRVVKEEVLSAPDEAEFGTRLTLQLEDPDDPAEDAQDVVEWGAFAPSHEALVYGLPNLQFAVSSGKHKIIVGREDRQLVPDAQLCQQRVYGPELDPGAATPIAEDRGVDVIMSIGYQQR